MIETLTIESGTLYLYRNALHLIEGKYQMQTSQSRSLRTVSRKIYPFNKMAIVNINHLHVGPHAVFVYPNGHLIAGAKRDHFEALMQYRIWLEKTSLPEGDLAARKIKRCIRAGRLTKNKKHIQSDTKFENLPHTWDRSD